jgi:hypothetical protein
VAAPPHHTRFLFFFATNTRTIMARALFLAAAIGCATATIELTPESFDNEVFGAGKAAFIKFLAPW